MKKFLLVPLLISLNAYSTENQGDYQLIGRGITGRTDGRVVQLVCIERINDICQKTQFQILPAYDQKQTDAFGNSLKHVNASNLKGPEFKLGEISKYSAFLKSAVGEKSVKFQKYFKSRSSTTWRFKPIKVSNNDLKSILSKIDPQTEPRTKPQKTEYERTGNLSSLKIKYFRDSESRPKKPRLNREIGAIALYNFIRFLRMDKYNVMDYNRNFYEIVVPEFKEFYTGKTVTWTPFEDLPHFQIESEILFVTENGLLYFKPTPTPKNSPYYERLKAIEGSLIAYDALNTFSQTK